MPIQNYMYLQLELGYSPKTSWKMACDHLILFCSPITSNEPSLLWLPLLTHVGFIIAPINLVFLPSSSFRLCANSFYVRTDFLKVNHYFINDFRYTKFYMALFCKMLSLTICSIHKYFKVTLLQQRAFSILHYAQE